MQKRLARRSIQRSAARPCGYLGVRARRSSLFRSEWISSSFRSEKRDHHGPETAEGGLWTHQRPIIPHGDFTLSGARSGCEKMRPPYAEKPSNVGNLAEIIYGHAETNARFTVS